MDLIQELRLEQPLSHIPQFRTDQKGIFWTVYDGDVPVAVVVRDIGTGGALLDVLRFRPRGPGRPATLPPYDFHYCTRLGYGATFNWSVDTMFHAPDHGSLKPTEQSPGRVAFIHQGEFKEGSTFSARLDIHYDPCIGQYAFDLTWDIRSRRKVTGEFCNVYHANLMHTDMSRREYDYGCYVRQGGSWEKYPVTVMVTGLQQNRLNGIPLELGGGSGHLNRNGIVPMIVHRRANVPLFVGSCNICFDLHQTAQVNAHQSAHIESRFVDVGPILARNPAACRRIELDRHEAYCFLPGRVCDFEEVKRREEPWSGGIWCTDGDRTAVATDQAHSGRHSLRLSAGPGQEVSMSPLMPALAFENHRDYEATVWVKTEGDDRCWAGVELMAFRFTPANPRSVASASTRGPHDWTRLSARVHSGQVDCGGFSLKFRGPGQAWFDDILVREVGTP